MSRKDHDDTKDTGREERIGRMKQQLEEMSGGDLFAWESDALAPEQRAAFWRHITEFETAPSTTHFEQLLNAGIELPDPASTTDASLTRKLWEVIGRLAEMRVFIFHTDHLSDRELYALLWSDILHDEVPLLPDDPGVWHIDLVGRGDETDTMLYLKYYADESERQQWLKDYADCGLSPHEEPPFDRDRHLPKPYESQQWRLPGSIRGIAYLLSGTV